MLDDGDKNEGQSRGTWNVGGKKVSEKQQHAMMELDCTCALQMY